MVYLETKIGVLLIVGRDNAVTNISLVDKAEPLNEEPTEAEIKAAHRIKEYFAGRRKDLDFPISPEGTEFQKKVWAAMRAIPYGKTSTYGALAEAIGCPKSARAVGMACNRNPILLAIPCHRVIGKNGALVGFACGLDIKRTLLELEKARG